MLTRTGAPPRTILAAVWEELLEGQAVTAHDVYTARMQLRGKALGV